MVNLAKYCNGDPCLVNPAGGSGVAITSITPASQDAAGRWINGAMINPGEGLSGYYGFKQGWDSFTSPAGPNLVYDAALNVDPGKTAADITFAAGVEGAIVKVISETAPEATFGRDRLAYAGVMTVCAVEPPANAFRPGIAAPSKVSHWTEPDMDLSGLRALTPPLTMPSVTQLIARHRWIVQSWNAGNDPGWHVTPTGNHEGYGTAFAADLGNALLCLNLNIDADLKRNLAVALVQRGIDIYARVQEGGDFNNGGGGHSAKKIPLFVAAHLLDDAGMKSYLGPSVNLFVEDDQYHVVDSSHVAMSDYLVGDIGTPEWMIAQGHSMLSREEDADYRTTNTRWQIAVALGVQLMGGKSTWNNDTFFDYVDRIMTRSFFDGSGTSAWATTLTSGNKPSQFHKDMWSSYRTETGMPAIWDW